MVEEVPEVTHLVVEVMRSVLAEMATIMYGNEAGYTMGSHRAPHSRLWTYWTRLGLRCRRKRRSAGSKILQQSDTQRFGKTQNQTSSLYLGTTLALFTEIRRIIVLADIMAHSLHDLVAKISVLFAPRRPCYHSLTSCRATNVAALQSSG